MLGIILGVAQLEDKSNISIRRGPDPVMAQVRPACPTPAYSPLRCGSGLLEQSPGGTPRWSTP